MQHLRFFACLVVFSLVMTTFSSAQEGQRRAVRKRKLIQGFVENIDGDNHRHHDEVGENRPKAKQRRKRPTESHLLDVPYEPEGTECVMD